MLKFKNMRVTWNETTDILETYLGDKDTDISKSITRKEGKVINTGGSSFGAYFIIELKDGTFVQKYITDVKKVPSKIVLPKIDRNRIEKSP